MSGGQVKGLVRVKVLSKMIDKTIGYTAGKNVRFEDPNNIVIGFRNNRKILLFINDQYWYLVINIFLILICN